MRKFRMTMVFMVCLVLLFSSWTVAGSEERTERIIGRFQAMTKCTAVSVVTYDHGDVRFYGDRDGLFQIGSMTKAFTGLAIQKLIHEGKLGEKDRVSDYLPWFEAYYGGEKVEITIEELMTQTSGFTNEEARYPSASNGQAIRDWSKAISGKELQSMPGEKYAYSNVNFNLLGVILEEVTGQSYRKYMESEILIPLGLMNTYVGEPDAASRVIEGSRLCFRQAIPYHLAVREGAIPAGYFYSNVKDLGRWMEIWLGVTEVSEEWQEIIFEVKGRLGETGDYYGGLERFENGSIGHSGGTPNYSSRIVFSESEDVGVCVLTNLNVAASTDSLCNGIFAAMTGGEEEGIQDDVWSIFDRIFTALCLVGFVALLVCIWSRKRVMMMVVGIISAVIMMACACRVRMMRKHENHKETGGGAAPHGDH